jgi:hypothetical protein
MPAFSIQKVSIMSFRRPEIIRSPSESRSYFLPLTSGCSNNKCTFCGYYGSTLQIRDLDDINKGVYVTGLPDIVFSIGRGWDGKKLFLQDGDALVYPFL